MTCRQTGISARSSIIASTNCSMVVGIFNRLWFNKVFEGNKKHSNNVCFTFIFISAFNALCLKTSRAPSNWTTSPVAVHSPVTPLPLVLLVRAPASLGPLHVLGLLVPVLSRTRTRGPGEGLLHLRRIGKAAATSRTTMSCRSWWSSSPIRSRCRRTTSPHPSISSRFWPA